MKLQDYTRELLFNDPRSLTEIAEATGLKVPWLCDFQQKNIRDAGCDKVEKLYEHLTNRTLLG